ncbi:MAG: hypothetical protein ACRDD7_01670, partial [Peptostreptococcaceae bacterium]
RVKSCNYRKSIFLSVAKVMTLIGAIFNTVALITLIAGSNDSFSTIIYAILLGLVWVARNKSFNEEHRGWMIYSIFIGAITSNVFDIIGYICALIESYRYRR